MRGLIAFRAFVGSVRSLEMSSLLDGACNCCACT